MAHEQFEQRFQARTTQDRQRTGLCHRLLTRLIGFRQRRDGAAAAEGHGEFFFLNAPRHGLDFVAEQCWRSSFTCLCVGRIVGQKFFGETHGAERQAE